MPRLQLLAINGVSGDLPISRENASSGHFTVDLLKGCYLLTEETGLGFSRLINSGHPSLIENQSGDVISFRGSLSEGCAHFFCKLHPTEIEAAKLIPKKSPR